MEESINSVWNVSDRFVFTEVQMLRVMSDRASLGVWYVLLLVCTSANFKYSNRSFQSDK